MDSTGAEILLGLIGIVLLICAWYWRQFRRLRTARAWPTTEATIQSGDMEVVAAGRGGEDRAPVFAFSYRVAGEYYSGRFSIVYSADNDALIQEMVNKKFQVHYNPAKPEAYLVPDDLVSSHLKIEQRLGLHFLGLYPRD
jgi:hypothetical protein